jgi:DNA invertase Pin-like site-specific DNA recombinase
VVRTYADSAKSGVGIRRRSGLRQLLQDAIGGNAGYKAILVYDVSRWGRFQDTDEPAHYEFLCKRAGIPVLYCAELFVSDGKLSGSIWKALRRSIAGEYSRELSAKCFAGQKRLVELGFRMGSRPGYGLRRMVVAGDHKRKRILATGEYKSLSTDRVILVPGPKSEVECVRQIYDMVLRHGKNPRQIADVLNLQGISYRDGKPWPGYAVEKILKNLKYTGSNVWNRTSRALGRPCITHSPESWIVKPDAFVPIIDRCTFDRVQRIRRKNGNRWLDHELLKQLRSLLLKKGRLTEKLISTAPGMASIATYYRRFGGFRCLYPMIGYTGETGAFEKSDRKERTLLLRDDLVGRLTTLFPGQMTVFHHVQDMRPILELDNGVQVARRICARKPTQRLRWRLYNGSSVRRREHVVLVCLLNGKGDGFYRYYIVPRVELPPKEQTLTANSSLLATGLRLDDLRQMYAAASLCAEKVGYAVEKQRLALERRLRRLQ